MHLQCTLVLLRIMKILLTLFVLFSSSLLAVSTTDKLAMDETSFYDQTSGAELVSCSIEFFGIDNNLNILNGSFGLNYFQSENKVALLFKLIHYEANTDGSIMKMHDIQDAFFELNNYLSNDLIQIKNDKESVLVMGDTINFINKGLVSETLDQSFKIIVNYKGQTLDKVFEFSSLDQNKIFELMSCSAKMLDK